MIGDVVSGYVVTESLGSGRVGLLYLAVHAQTGHRAVVRRRLNDADSADEFGLEAARSLALSTQTRVERRTSRGGVPVLLAIVDEAAPGSGRTEHANTQVLPDVPARRRRPSLLWLAPFLFLGVGLGWLAMRGESSITTPSAAPATVLAQKVEERPQPPTAPVTVLAAAPSPVVGPVSPLKKVARLESCEPDGTWKQKAFADLNELMHRSAPYKKLTGWTASENGAIGSAIDAAVTSAQCRAVQARLHSFHQRVLAAEAPAP